jgi:hypothetical protein
MPLIFACTADIIDEQLTKKIFETGFQGVYETPLSDILVKDEIIPQLNHRDAQINRKSQILSIIKDKIE